MRGGGALLENGAGKARKKCCERQAVGVVVGVVGAVGVDGEAGKAVGCAALRGRSSLPGRK